MGLKFLDIHLRQSRNNHYVTLNVDGSLETIKCRRLRALLRVWRRGALLAASSAR